jgi:heme-degrading monooxygenase HmoA
MTTVKITQLTASSITNDLQEMLSVNDSYYLGTKIQDKSIIQLTTPPSARLPSSLNNAIAPYTVRFNAPFFGATNAGSAHVVEHVLITFFNSRVTPNFRARIEADFAAFDNIVKRGAHGNLGVASGWVEEPLTHESLDEDATGFVVVRGWETMEDFENLLKTSEYAKAIPLLMAWEAPFEMVSFRFRIQGSDRLRNDVLVAR